MNNDYKLLKEKYGENFAKLCRQLFPTLLEEESLLPQIIMSKFAPNHELYEDIIEQSNIEDFKNYIYTLVDVEKKTIKTTKTVKELLDEVGYNFYECKTEEDIQYFKKYYQPKEELCTFLGGRLEKCYVFWAVKKNVEDIQRKDFQNPTRQDEYGTSVISIQFTRIGNTLSIKNRYNHSVNNPDATFSNNLDNIIPGLTQAFEKEYRLNINQSEDMNFELYNYVRANDERFYKSNYEISNINYCPDNTIIDNGEVKRLDKSRYLLIDYFVIDLKEKKFLTYDTKINDPIISIFNNIEKIEITKKEHNKVITIKQPGREDSIIEIDKGGRIIEITIPSIEEIKDYSFNRSSYLKRINLPDAKKIGNDVLESARNVEKIIIPKAEEIGDDFLRNNCQIKEIEIPQVKKIGDNCLELNEIIKKINAPNLKELGNNFMMFNFLLEEFNAENLERIGHNFLNMNTILSVLNVPKLQEYQYGFLANHSTFKKYKIIREKKNYLKSLKERIVNFSKRKEPLDEETANNRSR